MDFIESDVGGDILETVRTKIAEELNFTLSVRSFTDRDKINPAIVVVVERGNTVSLCPTCFWKLHRIEVFTAIVMPETYCGRAPMCKCEIHPAIVIEIKRGDPHCRTGMDSDQN